jgi:1,4-dihydroxy-2-naphthoate octaprenyltransferase
MAGLFIVLLVIIIVKYWYVVAGVIGLWLFWCLVLAPAWKREVAQARERQRHERARAEIDAVARAATQAMLGEARDWRP